MENKYVQYGCGLSAPEGWTNFDVSLTLRVQKTPILGKILYNQLNVIFPDNVKYGNIIKGLPGIKPNSCKGVYCSHTLEHLSLTDIKVALKNTFRILEPSGIFRCVVPDLQYRTALYLEEVNQGKKDAAITFIKWTELGRKNRPKSFLQHLKAHYSTSAHLWLWDELSLKELLKEVGFKNIRRCYFNDSKDSHFQLVEDESRFINALGLQASK